jgi:hypothetical protein
LVEVSMRKKTLVTLSQVAARLASRPYASNDFQAGGWVWAAWKSRTTEPR